MPRTFYRVESIYPLAKPTLVIGSPIVPAESGFITRYTKLTTSRKTARLWLRVLKRHGGFGRHSIQQMQFEPGTVVQTTRGTVVVEPPQKRRG